MYYTAHDALDYLMQSAGGGAQDQEHRVLRASLHHSYRDVSTSKDWLWYVTDSSITTVAGENSYLLPEDCGNVDALIPPDKTTVTSYISPAEWMRLEQSQLTLGEPMLWTVMKSTDPKTFDRWEIRIAGQVKPGVTLRFTYRRRPKPLTLMGYETQARTGYVTVAGAAVTGENTNFPTRCEGAVIRIGTPGNYPEPLSGFYPYQEQSRIVTRGGDEALTVEVPFVGTYTKCRFVISDWLDVSPGMFTAVLTGAELWMARMMGKDIQGALALYQRDWRLAAEQDVIAPVSGRRAPYDRVPDNDGAKYAGIYSPLGPDSGT